MNKEMDKQTKDEKLKTDEIQNDDNLDPRKLKLKDIIHSSEFREDGTLIELKTHYLSKDGKSFIEA